MGETGSGAAKGVLVGLLLLALSLGLSEPFTEQPHLHVECRGGRVTTVARMEAR